MTQSGKVELEYVYTADENARATTAVTREVLGRARGLRWLGAGLLLMALAAIATIPGAWRGALFPAIFGAFFLVGPLLIARFGASRNFRRLPFADATVRWTITHDALIARANDAVTQLEWRTLSKVVESKHGILVFATPVYGNWLPLHAFKTAADLETVRAWIEEHRSAFGRFTAASEKPAIESASEELPSPSSTPARGQTAASTCDEFVRGRYVFTQEEAERCRRALSKSAGPWPRVAVWILPAILLGYAASESVRSENWGFFAIMPPMMLGTVWFISRRMRKQRTEMFAKSPDANREIQLTVSAEGVDVRGAATGNSNYRWKSVIKARENADGFLLYLQPRVAQWMPARAFSSDADLERIRSWIRRHGIDWNRL